MTERDVSKIIEAVIEQVETSVPTIRARDKELVGYMIPASTWREIRAQLRRVAAAQDQERVEHRQRLGEAWTAFLDVAMDSVLDDGSTLLGAVFAENPELRQKLKEALRHGRG